jgi:hypothetical protein
MTRVVDDPMTQTCRPLRMGLLPHVSALRVEAQKDRPPRASNTTRALRVP